MREGCATGWREATERALYGPGGFFVREAPAAHFRTSVHASPLFAGAVARLLVAVDAELGCPRELAFVDMGAGRGELAGGVLAAVPGEVAARLRVYAVERGASRPGSGELDGRVEWCAEPPPLGGVTGLLFANEWLDNVPVDVAEVDGEGVTRYVLVDAAGRERLGGEVAGADAAWLRRWWPRLEPGARAEIGLPRDEAWAGVCARVARGLAVAVDYAHVRERRPPFGTLAGYRDGREVRPVPDGTCDLTSHVALDACAAAFPAGGSAPEPPAVLPQALGGLGEDGEREPGRSPGAPVLLAQRVALRQLGVDARRPPVALAASDPAAYVRALACSGEAAELTAPDGLGGFTWLAQPVGIDSPIR